MNRRQHGFGMVYSMVMIAALMVIVSLGVDLGRVQLAKTELRRAADAAARFAATGIEDLTYLTKAQAAAADNLVDGSVVTISAANVVVGNWDAAQSPRFSTSRTPVNSVQVSLTRNVPTVFMRLLGMNTCEVSARSTVSATVGQVSYGCVGLNWVMLDSNAQTDSYDSSVGAYSSSWSPDKGSLASNGSITLNPGNTVRGDARPGPGQTCAGGTVTGVRTPIPSSLSYPAPVASGPYNNGVIPSGYMAASNFTLKDDTYTLPAGTYSFHNFRLEGNSVLNVGGPVTIYVSGKIDIEGNSGTGVHRPGNLRIRVTSSMKVDIDGNNGIYADLYAPQSDVDIDSNKHFYGMIVGKTLHLDSNAYLHVDESLSSPTPTPFPLTLVE